MRTSGTSGCQAPAIGKNTLIWRRGRDRLDWPELDRIQSLSS
ncbi:MAG TPA: hypothetical protein VJN96_22575 [Vicinamibacterales bacterium]|nr:hypothetical protein [Vicinamibacterales bacterium]